MPTVTELLSFFLELDLIHLLGLDYVNNPQKRLYWPYLLTAFLIAIFVLKITQQSFSSVFNKDIWWHHSARLDYAYFTLASIIKLSLILPFMLGINEVAFSVVQWMQSVFGFQPKLNINHSALMVLYTFALFVFSDLSRYWLHRAVHKIPFLWEFHKVHHSAEVLTPMTFYRIHPIENILYGLRYALVAGTVTGVFVYYFGAALAIIDIFGINLLVITAHFMGDNIRHSALRLSYYDGLENWLISPAQHQFHHTLTGNSYNFGGVFAVWDRVFGTLQYSHKNQSDQFGVSDKVQYNSILRLFFLPFKKIFRHD